MLLWSRFRSRLVFDFKLCWHQPFWPHDLLHVFCETHWRPGQKIDQWTNTFNLRMPVEIKASTIQTFYGGFSHQHQVLRVVIKLGSHRILTKFIHISGMELICKAWNRISGRLGSVLFFLSFWAAMIPADSFLLPSLARRQRTEPNASVPDGFGPLAQFWQHAGGRSRRLDTLKARDHSPALQLIGKSEETNMGRSCGRLNATPKEFGCAPLTGAVTRKRDRIRIDRDFMICW